MSHLLLVVLLYLVEFQEGIFSRKLPFQRIEENLFLRHLRLAVLQRDVDSPLNISLVQVKSLPILCSGIKGLSRRPHELLFTFL